jgi:hypothetical protein
MAKRGRWLDPKEIEVREMRDAERILGIIERQKSLESRMMRKYQVRFGGGRMEKEHANDTSPAAYPTVHGAEDDGRGGGHRPVGVRPVKAIPDVACEPTGRQAFQDASHGSSVDPQPPLLSERLSLSAFCYTICSALGRPSADRRRGLPRATTGRAWDGAPGRRRRGGRTIGVARAVVRECPDPLRPG